MDKDKIAWRTAPKKKRVAYKPKRIYDVLVTTNKSGVRDDGRRKTPVVRFGLINRAGIAFNEYEFITFSEINKGTEAIYFQGVDEKVNGAFTLSSSRSDQASKYFQFTPTEGEMVAVIDSWEDRAFPIRFDEGCGLYYISKADGVVKPKKQR